jgi:hypothetical protein
MSLAETSQPRLRFWMSCFVREYRYSPFIIDADYQSTAGKLSPSIGGLGLEVLSSFAKSAKYEAY